MRISEFLSVEGVVANLSARSKPEVLNELATILNRVAPAISQTRFLTVLQDREKLVSTGMEKGVAIPHGRLAELPTLVAVFAVSREGVDFEALDGKKSHFFFALVAPEQSAGLHLKALSKINRLFRSEALKSSVLQADSAAALHALIATEDARA